MNFTNNSNSEVANLYFKVANTENTAIFSVPTYLCIANFIEFVKYKAYNEFNINRNQEIEIVEAGQGNNQLRSEDAPALTLEFNQTVREKYNGVYTNLAFYIRIV